MTAFLNDAEWRDLIATAVKAAQDDADPDTEVAMTLSPFVCPESAREDIDAQSVLSAS
ncbi:hypothetical protein [Paracoccus salipaludis]|uniref:hypothetical protein n=1 Tax=Paracoccus salipaludis TaxID=2032623 RepID=UPI00142FAD47|nr:hypothetical protein [Paracoccus salipaludis]